MGQKINPTIFRLGVNKTWKTEFFEKKNHELPLYVFKDLEVRNYIERVLETYGIILHDYKQHYNGSTLNLYVSYFVTSDFIVNKKEIVEKLIIKNSAGDKKNIENLSNTVKSLAHYHLSDKIVNPSDDFSRLYKLKQYFNSSPSIQLPLPQQNFSTKIVSKTGMLDNVNVKANGIFDQVFEVLNLFSDNKLDLTLNLCCTNKDLYFLKFSQEKLFISLQKFRNTPFFKEGIEVLFHVAYNSNSANLLAKFIAFQLKKIKRQKFFLSFLKQALTILSNSGPSKIKGVKIVIKGRLNGVPRAKQKRIIIGDVPAQSISANLDYSQATIHNSNGSYGIQVWVVEK
jgi:ribosomal protein S3